MTSSTVVFMVAFPRSTLSEVNGVYDVMRKWARGEGMSEARIPHKSLFIYPGYRSVVVEVLITVLTS